MNETAKENAKEIAELYMEVQKKLDGTNICMSGDIYFRRIHDKIAFLSENTVGIVREMNNSNVHRGTYNIYLMCEPDIYAEIIQYTDEENTNKEDEENES